MSVSKQAKRRGTILDEIMAYHRQQLPRLKRAVPLADLRALVRVAPPPLDVAAALTRPGVGLIAECKKASPSRGLLRADYDAAALARQYARAGASAISVLTDARHFQGDLVHLRDVKEALTPIKQVVADKGDPRRQTGIPVLRKDFIFDPYQVYEARAAGADALLLIVAVLAPSELADLLALTRELGMTALVEVHDDAELETALACGPQVVGINNRNLQTFEVDFENTGRLRARIPAGVAVVGESGIKNAADVARMAAIGVDAVLVGETLVRSKDPGRAARQLVAAGRAGS